MPILTGVLHALIRVDYFRRPVPGDSLFEHVYGEKGYLIPYKFEDGHIDGGTDRKLIKVGVNISTQTRTLESWLVAE